MEIYILRHGIAETARAGADDAGRALVPEGKRKLRSVLNVAKAAGVSPALILTSPLRRALETAEIAAEVFGRKEKVTRTDALKPGRTPNEVWEEIRTYRGKDQVLVSGHEPQLGYLAAFLLGAPSLLVDLKKGSLMRIDLDGAGSQPRGILRWYLTAKLATGAP